MKATDRIYAPLGLYRHDNDWDKPKFLTAQRSLEKATEEVQIAFLALSSGQRVNRPSDDPSYAVIVEGLKSQRRSVSADILNSQQALIGAIEADSQFGTRLETLTQLAELSEQAANGLIRYHNAVALGGGALQENATLLGDNKDESQKASLHALEVVRKEIEQTVTQKGVVFSSTSALIAQANQMPRLVLDLIGT